MKFEKQKEISKNIRGLAKKYLILDPNIAKHYTHPKKYYSWLNKYVNFNTLKIVSFCSNAQNVKLFINNTINYINNLNNNEITYEYKYMYNLDTFVIIWVKFKNN